jgi:bacterioferritin
MHEKSVELLNKAIGDELSAIHQYMYFHFHCHDRGYQLLANLFEKTAIDEMRHVEKAAERILFLQGEVEMKPSESVEKIHKVRDMLERAAVMEKQSAQEYNEWANECAANADSASKRVFEDLVLDEERHYDQFSTEMENFDQLGDQYLALHSIEHTKGIT